MAVISSLLAHLGFSDAAARSGEDPASMNARTLRRRLTPPEDLDPTTAQRKSWILPLRSSPPSMAGLPWQVEESEAEWKPVVLSDFELSIPAVPSLDELAEEGGISPAEPRFPFDT
jgi:hypothetical protein